jgi:carbonic anhydrase
MKLGTLALVAVLAALGCRSASFPSSTASPSSPRSTASQVAWSYEGATGPAHWGELSPAYRLASTGRSQSPIDIRPAECVRADLPSLQLSYGAVPLEILNNGHTIEVEYDGDGALTVDGHSYTLVQFHFHAPSEHTLKGEHSAMELHLVHADADGELAVIGVLIAQGRASPALAELWAHMPSEPGPAESVPEVRVDPTRLLPGDLASWRYAGSLTVPPCTEGVRWFVLQDPIEASAEQIATFRRVIGKCNRPVQPLNGRVVTATD